MRTASLALAAAALAAATVATAACSSSPAGPSVTPTPLPTPTPAPTAPTNPDVPPASSGCGQPYPPPVTRFQVKIHQKDRDYWQLDSTPLVGPDASYCWEVGFTDGRTICPVRPESAPDRLACELWRVGKAKDTGRNEPTWTFVGKDGKESYCSNAADAPCRRYEDGEHFFQVMAIQGGLYRACTEAGACGTVDVDRGL